ncbi:MAG: hypothetical protein KH196_00335 [Oscillospiraceae bacterium]|nr:hypothetical protein [Oscillospiraceae bacterium]
MSEQQKAPIRDTQVDEILAQVEKKRASHGGRTPKASEAQLDAILKSMGLGERKRPRYSEPILLPSPVPEQAPAAAPAAAPAQAAQQGAQAAPRQAGAPQGEEPAEGQKQPPAPEAAQQPEPEPEKEPTTVELPTAKSYAVIEDKKKEAERQRMLEQARLEMRRREQAEREKKLRAAQAQRVRRMEQARREAAHTIHNSAQFAVQDALAAHMRQKASEAAAAAGEKPVETPAPAAPAPAPVRQSALFGEVDDQFRAFFATTVATNREDVERARRKKKGGGLFARLRKKEPADTAELAALWGEEASESFTQELGNLGAIRDAIDQRRAQPPEQAAPAQEPAPVQEAAPARAARLQAEEKSAQFSFGAPAPEKKGGVRSAFGNIQVQYDDLTGAAPKKQPIDITLGGQEGAAQAAQPQRRSVSVAREEMDEYVSLSDAPAVAENLDDMRRTRLLRAVACGLSAVLLLYLGLAGRAGAVPALLSPQEAPLVFLLVNFVLLAATALISLSTMITGVLGLWGEPSTDSFCAVAVLAALAQNGAWLFASAQFDAGAVTLYAPVAAFLLCANAVGKWMQMNVVCRNFDLISASDEQAAAFVLPREQMVRRLCSGLAEEEPVVLVSRRTALVKDFLAQSFSVRLNDGMAQKLSWVMAAGAAVCAVVAGVKAQSPIDAMGALAASACLAAPLACTLVYAVPARLMQSYAARHKAVIPGPSAVNTLQYTNTVLLSAEDLFPVGSVQLHGIKTFEKERIDLAILYAASILESHCETLRDIFMAILQNDKKLLLPVEGVKPEAGYGFTAWVDHNRIILGNRAMMARHDIELPSMDYENRYTKNGARAAIYLAVAGKLYGMFLVSYLPNRKAASILEQLTGSGTSVLIRSSDFNVTSELVAATYGVPRNMVKVLTQTECDLLETETAYRPESEGVLIHSGSCASFLGGLRAALCAAQGEHMARLVQAAAIILSALLGVILAFAAGLGALSLGAVLVYQLAWCVLTLALPVLKKP